MTANLRDAGFRFVYARGLRGYSDFEWIHHAEVPTGAVDCTDMTDAEFDAFVSSIPTSAANAHPTKEGS